VENEAIQRVVVVGRNQARRLTDRTVDIGDNPTGSANDVMVVVADPRLITGNHSQWLDPPNQTYRRQRVSTSYTAWRETSGRPLRTADKIVSVSACGWECTASSTATLGRVTRKSAIRSCAA
jgi:hypothetical protein